LTDRKTDTDLTRLFSGAKLFSDDRADFARLGKRTMDALADYMIRLPDDVVDRVVPEEQRKYLSSLEFPEHGMSADDVISFMEQHVMPWPQATGHQRSYGWVNSPPMPISVLAETVAQTMNAALDGYDFSGIFLMVSLSRWLIELAGYQDGEESMAILFSGALFLALIAIFPSIISSPKVLNIPFLIASFFGGTGLLIIVGVVLDTMKQIESQLLMRHYEGFIKKGKLKARR